MWAFCSLQASPACRAYYQQRRALGDGHNQALRALANRLVAFLHGCLSTRRLYDEEAAWGSLKSSPPDGRSLGASAGPASPSVWSSFASRTQRPDPLPGWGRHLRVTDMGCLAGRDLCAVSGTGTCTGRGWALRVRPRTC